MCNKNYGVFFAYKMDNFVQLYTRPVHSSSIGRENGHVPFFCPILSYVLLHLCAVRLKPHIKGIYACKCAGFIILRILFVMAKSSNCTTSSTCTHWTVRFARLEGIVQNWEISSDQCIITKLIKSTDEFLEIIDLTITNAQEEVVEYVLPPGPIVLGAPSRFSLQIDNKTMQCKRFVELNLDIFERLGSLAERMLYVENDVWILKFISSM